MRKGFAVKPLVFAMLLMAIHASPLWAAPGDELTPYLSAARYSWEEYDGGKRLLRESGYLFSGGTVLESVLPHSVTLRERGELFGGVVGYSGQTQEGIPVDTDVNYLGLKGELDLGYRIAASRSFLEPFCGAGVRWWLRGLRDSTDASGGTATGYTEDWLMGYLRLGVRGRYEVAPATYLFAEAGAKKPFYTGNTVDSVTVRPDGELSAFAELGTETSPVQLSLFYEGFRFSHSPPVVSGRIIQFQPDSSSDIFGLRLGLAFR